MDFLMVTREMPACYSFAVDVVRDEGWLPLTTFVVKQGSCLCSVDIMRLNDLLGLWDDGCACAQCVDGMNTSSKGCGRVQGDNRQRAPHLISMLRAGDLYSAVPCILSTLIAMLSFVFFLCSLSCRLFGIKHTIIL